MRLVTSSPFAIILVAHQLLCIADAYVSVPTRSGAVHRTPQSLRHGRNSVVVCRSRLVGSSPLRLMSEDDINAELSSISNTSNDDDDDDSKKNDSSSSKREMLKFAIPALGIYLTNPLLSNIDNAFVGRTVGAVGLGKHKKMI